MADTSSILAYDGSSIDGSWYLDVTRFAHDTSWLNGVADTYTSIGVGLFAVFMVVGWWIARSRPAAAMAAAIAAPVSAVLAYLVNDAIKSVVKETRPCIAYPHAFLVKSCPPATDYSFPSNHSVIVAAVTVSLLFVSVRLGLVSLVFAALMGFSRVYVGAHYPHDVFVGLAVGAIVGLIVTLLFQHFGARFVERLRSGALRPVLGDPDAEPAGRHAANSLAH